MVERARSGHPGLPLGAAPMAFVLWDRFLRHAPTNPRWPDRDRFVLSAGHGSALLYSLLHLTGYDLPLEELQRFRRLGSRTPGHPEVHLTPGVEVTSGPLGQGFAMAVGLALAERFLAHRFNRDGFPIVDHWTYVLASDGDLMEGISAEAASFAGHLGLGRLICLYDDNQVSLEGPTRLSFSEDAEARFRAYGWSTTHVPDGTDTEAIAKAIQSARDHPETPWLIRVRTHIGHGSPKQDTREAHGEPLGPSAVAATKTKLGWPLEPPFRIPPDVKERFHSAVDRGRAWEAEWDRRVESYARAHPNLADEFRRAIRGELPPGWDRDLPRFEPSGGELATRDAASRLLDLFASRIPTLVGGSADLAPSTKTLIAGETSFGPTGGRNIHFGVREHAMVGILNGMAMHGGVRPFGSTFLVFSDYARAAIRLAALQRARILLIFTHDSIGLGEDGPTHEPIEHLWSLRAIPGLTLLRPADANETTAAWTVALEREGPVALVLTRQKLPVLDPAKYPTIEGARRGGYILETTPGGPPQLVVAATGSEVHLAREVVETLSREGVRAQLVSLPSLEVFQEQPEPYRETVLPTGIPRLIVEAGSTIGWANWIGERGRVIGLDRFGASAPGPDLFRHFGFTVENLVREAKLLLAGGN